MKFYFSFCLLLLVAAHSCKLPKEKTIVSPESVPAAQLNKLKMPMAAVANSFIESLDPKLKESTVFPFDHVDREEWDFVPLDNRIGGRIGYMNDEQQKLAFGLLKSGLSDVGYKLARDIMSLEEVLIIKEKQEEGSDYRNPEKYYISIFGEPSDSDPWGWTYEGHHLSLNYSSVSDKLSVTPAFLGSNPANVDIDMHRGLRVLGDREDMGRDFMLSLSAEQQAIALVSKEAYDEILTFTDSHAHIDGFTGIPYNDLTSKQQQDFRDLIKTHMNIMKPEVIKEKWAKIESDGLSNFYFAWAGALEMNQKHYYRIHGPTTIIEYDNAQNSGNHAHIVWRDTENDFGRDILKEHYAKHKH